jgi:phytoene desaturase
MKSVIIIGAGLGGLAAALRLRYLGFEVTVLEKQARPGGRSNVIEENGFRVDTGPTILVMKDMLEETYRAIGRDVNERIRFMTLDPHYRIYFHDETYLDLYANMAQLSAEVEKIEPGAAERLFRFLGESAKKYELGMDFVIRNYDHITDLANPVAGARLIRTSAYRNLYGQVSRFFNTDKLRKAFTFHSMFLGLSPFEALAMYSLITYADLAKGMHFPVGGIYSIIEDMVRLASGMGVEIRTGTSVEEILIENGRAVGVRLAATANPDQDPIPAGTTGSRGEQLRADIVVSNADLPYTYRNLIPLHYRGSYTDKRLDSMSYACSGYVLYLGIDKVFRNLRHQALFFAEDYRANLDAIFRTKTLPEAISFHLSNPTSTDPSLALPGHSLLYVLAPMPNLTGRVNWDQAAPVVREKLLDQLERLVAPDIRQHIVWERQYRPTDYLHDINAVYGTAFGSLSMGFRQATYFRPHNKAPGIEGLYFVGQGTYPGIGMPMVLISARLLAERLTA